MDSDALTAYELTHGPVMRRQGERGATYSSALDFARTAAKGNAGLLKLIDELKIRDGKKSTTTTGS